ncbi:hypothetical protein ABPG77_007811 [Micractinium sp. CCAP 211/92]
MAAHRKRDSTAAAAGGYCRDDSVRPFPVCLPTRIHAPQLLCACLPRRAWLAPLLRIGVACLPSVRRMGLGAAMALERPAQAGAAGALLDLLRLLLGTRVVVAFCLGLGAMLPPLSSLLCQTALTGLLMNSAEACQTEILRHPLTRSRMTATAGLLDIAALPFAAFQPALPLMWRQLDGEALCQASVSALMVTAGVVLPCLASALCWQPAECHAQCPQQRQQQGQRRGRQEQQARLGPEGEEEEEGRRHLRLCAARGKMAEAAAAADSALHRLCGGQLPLHGRLAALWFWVAVTWLLSKQVAGRLRPLL